LKRATRGGGGGGDLAIFFFHLIRTEEAVEFVERDLAVLVVVDHEEETVELLVGVMEVKSSKEFADVALVEVALVVVVDGVEEILQQLGGGGEGQRKGRRGHRGLTSRRAGPVTLRRLLALVLS
jgi:hypothetical protein